MAELHVQTKKQSNTTWIWILVALLAIAAIVYYVATRDKANNTAPVSQPGAAAVSKPQPKAGTYGQDEPIYVPVVYMRSV